MDKKARNGQLAFRLLHKYHNINIIVLILQKIRDTKGIFYEKMGTIKDRNGTDLTEAKDTKKRWQEYTEEVYKKDLHDPDNHDGRSIQKNLHYPDNHDGVITHLEPDILECKVKWALGSITINKASGGDGIPVELFQILKDDAVKVLHSICKKFGNSSGQWTGKGQFSFQSQRKAMPKNVQSTVQLRSSHMLANTQNSPSQASTVCEP